MYLYVCISYDIMKYVSVVFYLSYYNLTQLGFTLTTGWPADLENLGKSGSLAAKFRLKSGNFNEAISMLLLTTYSIVLQANNLEKSLKMTWKIQVKRPWKVRECTKVQVLATLNNKDIH